MNPYTVISVCSECGPQGLIPFPQSGRILHNLVSEKIQILVAKLRHVEFVSLPLILHHLSNFSCQAAAIYHSSHYQTYLPND